MSAQQPGPADLPAEDIEETDPFAARERTELAWTRTAIAFAAMGAALLKIRPWTGVPIIGFSAIVWLLGQVHRARAPEHVVAGRVRVVTVAIVALAIAAAILVLAGRPSAGLRILESGRPGHATWAAPGRIPALRGLAIAHRSRGRLLSQPVPLGAVPAPSRPPPAVR